MWWYSEAAWLRSPALPVCWISISTVPPCMAAFYSIITGANDFWIGKKKKEKLTELLIHNVCTQSHDGIRLLLQVWPLFEVPQCELLFRWRVCREKWLHSTLSICFKLFSTLVLDESPFFKTDFGLTNSLKHSAITAHRAATSPLSPHRHNTHPLYSSFN